MPRDPNRQGGVRSAVTRLRVSKKKIVFYFCECPYRLGKKKKMKNEKKNNFFYMCLTCSLLTRAWPLFHFSSVQARRTTSSCKHKTTKIDFSNRVSSTIFLKNIENIGEKKKKENHLGVSPLSMPRKQRWMVSPTLATSSCTHPSKHRRSGRWQRATTRKDLVPAAPSHESGRTRPHPFETTALVSARNHRDLDLTKRVAPFSDHHHTQPRPTPPCCVCVCVCEREWERRRM